jgi:hypothetical protein
VKKPQEFYCPWQGTPLWKKLRKQFSMTRLKSFRFLWIEVVPKFTPRRARKQPPTHPYTPVNTPTINWYASFRERALPREDVSIDSIDKSPIEVKD